MVGPSSSHTAGAARIGLAAHYLLGNRPVAARIELHGSFAATGQGHATDRAIVAGLMGWRSDDERLKDSIEIARATGMQIEFLETDLGEDAHPNSARLSLTGPDGKTCRVTGASLGGGMIEIRAVDLFESRFTGSLRTLAIWHDDMPGFLAKLTTVIACADVNIAAIRTSRKSRASQAFTIVETDEPTPPDCVSVISRIAGVHRLCQIPPLTD